MDDFGNCLSNYDWIVWLFPYFPDAAHMTAEGNYHGGH